MRSGWMAMVGLVLSCGTAEDVTMGCTDLCTMSAGSTTTGEPTSGSASTSGSGSTSGSESTSGDSGDESSTGTTGEEGCAPGWADDLPLGPEPVMLDEGVAVPVDVVDLRARLVIDVAAEVTTAEVTWTFRVGATAGRPVFDLRQEPTAGDLDGEAVAAADLWTRDLGGGPGAEMRVLDRELPACSEHVLRLAYPLVRPPGFAADPPGFDEDGVDWDFTFNDIAPRMFLEQWLPANLIHDRHPIALTLEIFGGAADQRVISNGDVTAVGATAWEVTWPARSTALSPMLVLKPASEVASFAGEVDGTTLEVHRHATIDADPADLHAELAALFAAYTASTGPTIHPRFTAFVVQNAGMEYDGGTTADETSLAHEVFHSWFGRGVQPMRGADGWLDEAWDEFNTGASAFTAAAIDPGLPPKRLCDRNPWTRATSIDAYDDGEAVFAAIAAEAGVEPLRASMRAFYAAHAGERVRTEDVERHLHCTLPAAAVRAVFHRFVYGSQGEPAAPPDDYCG